MPITRRDSIQNMLAAAAALTMPCLTWAEPKTSNGRPVIRIAFNENPDGPSPAARAVLHECVPRANRYVMDEMQDLERTIARREGVPVESVVLGSGSGEVLAMASAAYAMGGGQLVCADNTFFLLPRYAEAVGGRVLKRPLTETQHHDLKAMAAAVDGQTKLVYVCNPNNPTGTALDATALRDFCLDVGRTAVVLVDEAYLDYEPDLSASMIELVRQGRNVIVTRTFSKIYGMAGLRIGYGLAPVTIAERLKRLRMTWINHLSVRAAQASLGDEAFVRASRQRNTAAREVFCAALRRRNIRYVPSHANFVYVYAGPKNRELPGAMLAQGVMIEREGRALTGDWARVSVGTLEEMQVAAAAVQRLYQS